MAETGVDVGSSNCEIEVIVNVALAPHAQQRAEGRVIGLVAGSGSLEV